MANNGTRRVKTPPTHTKDQLIRSKALSDYSRDVMNAVLTDGRMYTLKEAIIALDEFLNKRV